VFQDFTNFELSTKVGEATMEQLKMEEEKERRRRFS